MTEVHFDDREDAWAFAGQFEGSRVRRDEFAGEDDADDAGWVVEVSGDAVEEAAESFGGWVVAEVADPGPGVVDLPEGPRRFKNPSAPRPLPRTVRRSAD